MSAPVFLADDLSSDVVVLTGPEGRHAATVRRLRVGEAVDLCDGRGGRASCVVSGLGRDEVTLEVRARTAEPAPSPRLVLVQALAKGDRGELAVELATEVGVDEVVPWSAARCVTRWEGERGERARARWASTAREAGKQSRRAWHPLVPPLASTAQVAKRLAGAASSGAPAGAPTGDTSGADASTGRVVGLVLHEAADVALTSLDLSGATEVVVVVGPEGGIAPEELELLGGAVVRLGASVLRTSTAGAAALAVVSAMTGRW